MRNIIAAGTSNRFLACASGIGVTALLQSSTAATLLLISFVKKNRIPLAAALAVIIGADISTTLVAQVLTFDLSWLSPMLLIIGIAGHIKFEHGGRKKHVFRVFIGLGLMLLSLALIRDAAAPLANSETLPLILAPLEADPIMAIAFSAILTWVMHSSLAAVLLYASLASAGIVDLELGILLVLGANLGGAFIAFVVTFKDGVTARRITVGNIIMRCATIVVFALALPYVLAFVKSTDLDMARNIVNVHMGFNVILALLFLPTVQWVAKLCESIIPEDKNKKQPKHEPLYLDEQAIDAPVVALAAAARETLRMAEMVQKMLEQSMECFKANDSALANTIERKDATVDKLYSHIKLYLTKLSQESLDPKEADRYLQILNFATNLEYVGDIIEKSLVELARKKIKYKERFSNEGWEEIKHFHSLVVKNMSMAQTIFLSEDPNLAQKLVDEKQTIRAAAKATSEQHFERLSDGLPESIATSALHLDIIRDYRRINTYMTGVAYSILENAKKYEDKRHPRNK